MSDNILDMDIPKLMDSQQVLSIETRSIPQSSSTIINHSNIINSLTMQVPVVSNETIQTPDVSNVSPQEASVPNVIVQGHYVSNMTLQDPDVSIVST